MTVGTHTAFLKAVTEAYGDDSLTLVETSDMIDKIWATKYEEELALLIRAIEITARALDEIGPAIVPGMTEAQVAWDPPLTPLWDLRLVAIHSLLASLPFALPLCLFADDTVIRDGQPIVIDMGAAYEGYCADLTRTIFVGEPDGTFKKVYSTVLRAQLAALEQVRSGMTGEETDAISRDVIVEAGYGDAFGHSLGHGVGLAVHEYPRVGPRASDVLADGMVFTIEPGIYLPDWGGVRIEDVVVMESGRARVLSNAAKMDVDL